MFLCLENRRSLFSHKVFRFYFLSPETKFPAIENFYGLGVYSWVVVILIQERIRMFWYCDSHIDSVDFPVFYQLLCLYFPSPIICIKNVFLKYSIKYLKSYL